MTEYTIGLTFLGIFAAALIIAVIAVLFIAYKVLKGMDADA